MFSTHAIKGDFFSYSNTVPKIDTHTLHAILGHVFMKNLHHLPVFDSLVIKDKRLECLV